MISIICNENVCTHSLTIPVDTYPRQTGLHVPYRASFHCGPECPKYEPTPVRPLSPNILNIINSTFSSIILPQIMRSSDTSPFLHGVSNKSRDHQVHLPLFLVSQLIIFLTLFTITLSLCTYDYACKDKH